MNPRLEPIEKPDGLMVRFVYWMTRRRFGKVPTGVKVTVARVPSVMKVSVALHKVKKGMRLDDETFHLMAMLVSSINGCGFCMDLGRMMAVKKNMGMDKINALPQYKTSPLFTARQKAALAYTEEVTLNKKPSDATFDALRHHFDDQEVVELTIVIAMEHFANLINVPLGIESDGLCAIATAKQQAVPATA